MAKQGVTVDQFRAVDHPIATGVYPDMRERGWDVDEWPELFPRVLAADILVIGGPIWLGDNSSETKKIIERLYAHSGELNDKGQWLYYGRVGGCLITGNEDGIKHCTSNVLYSLQHIGYSIPPQADAGWIGEAGPGPSYGDVLEDGTRGGTGQRLHQPQHHLHDLEPAASGPDAEGRRRLPRLRQPAAANGTPAPVSTSKTPNTAPSAPAARGRSVRRCRVSSNVSSPLTRSSRSTNFWIFPDGVRGSSSRNAQYTGILCGAIRGTGTTSAP